MVFLLISGDLGHDFPTFSRLGIKVGLETLVSSGLREHWFSATCTRSDFYVNGFFDDFSRKQRPTKKLASHKEDLEEGFFR